ncbi:Homeobox protein 31 [Tripterygium wilfordii]|uniref:Homeobox protein 31 n=1 Tax=Tripterygium wilfordii TaxID=458696 RepID=A0A7J7CGH4_TRIWF|nr:zinc-finger homeodomain protein 4-like [Tripterygium wilfordii]KAF5733141.1 Homeobox protein 31 [Tripterygium wilfordii]
MELSRQEGGDIPIPINTAFGVGHMIHHHDHHHLPNSSNDASSIPTSLNHHQHDHANNNKRVVRYRECLKNHAATMGGNATDGCGEFMPSGEEGSIEALTCSVCNCHRNFHRKEVEGEPSSSSWIGRKLLLGHSQHHHHKNLLGRETLPPGYQTHVISSREAPTSHQMMMSYNNNIVGSMLPSESDEQEDIHLHRHQLVKKRFRTKFTQEQKEKMLSFAEKVGWKIQKQEESVVQQLCQEIGVKRRVLKVWMHNNKHNLSKKINNNTTTNNNIIVVTATATATSSA